MPKGKLGRLRAACHPELLMHSRGLCKSCWGKMRRGPLKPRVKMVALCHPERRHKCKNMCNACCSAYLYDRNGGNSSVAATCHPDRSHFGRGLCKPCYKAAYREIKPYDGVKYWHAKWDGEFGWESGTHQKLFNSATHCALCGEVFDLTERHGPLSKVTDHCHATGKFRGIIHHRCNTAIAKLNDSETKCLLAAAYLRGKK